MIRSAFKQRQSAPRQDRSSEFATWAPRPREIAVAVAGPARATVAVPAPKDGAIQHQGYMAAVRRLPCYRCGVVGLTQFCHRDEGKGLGLKTDCREGWPGCGPNFLGDPGCHWLIGTSGRFDRALRRVFEFDAGIATRATIRNMGQWPATLPAWVADEVSHGLV